MLALTSHLALLCAVDLVCRELASNVSPDLIRDFDERWWQAAKKVNSSSSSSTVVWGHV
jgi:hypothetical protein